MWYTTWMTDESDEIVAIRARHQRLREKRKGRAEMLRRRRHAARTGLPQPTVCDCCGQPPDAGKGLCLDHCHETGKLRGWLCHSCNLGIGLLGDNVAALTRALRYLDNSSARGWVLTEHPDGTVGKTVPKYSPSGPPSRRVAGILPWLEWIATGQYTPGVDTDD